MGSFFMKALLYWVDPRARVCFRTFRLIHLLRDVVLLDSNVSSIFLSVSWMTSLLEIARTPA